MVMFMTTSPLGDMNKVPPGKCAARMARAGKLTQVDQWLRCLSMLRKRSGQ